MLLKETTISASNLKGLEALLNKFLQGSDINQCDMNLSNIELVLFCLFITKKKYLNLGKVTWDSSCLFLMRAQNLNKRSEQNYKIILKPFFRKIICLFNREKNLPKNEEDSFYKNHFESICSNLNLDWRNMKFERIFNETRFKKSCKGRVRSKKHFARVLTLNSEIMKQLGNYLNDQLLLGTENHGVHWDNSNILAKKLAKLISKWRNQFNLEKRIKSRLTNFVLDSLENPKMKLPWGMAEVFHAVQSLTKLFSNI